MILRSDIPLGARGPLYTLRCNHQMSHWSKIDQISHWEQGVHCTLSDATIKCPIGVKKETICPIGSKGPILYSPTQPPDIPNLPGLCQVPQVTVQDPPGLEIP